MKILLQIEEVAEETDGGIPDELWDVLIISKEELNDKVAAYVFRMEELKAQQEALKAQLEVWSKKIERKTRSIEFLKAGLGEAAKRLGERNKTGNYSLQAGELKVNYQFTHSVEIEDEKLVPEEYKTYDVTIPSLTKKEYDKLMVILTIQDDIENLIVKVPEIKISKTTIKNAIETAEDIKRTSEFTTSETVPGAFIDNKKGFIKIY
jgi:prefoldin subunit 5